MNALNLLVRGSFIISVKSDEAGSNSMNDAMLDKFYAEQLNHLISENINFVDVSFDVQSFQDYNTSGDLVFQRNYYYNVGKSFLNDRARINYKGSLGITSDLQAERSIHSSCKTSWNLRSRSLKTASSGRYSSGKTSMKGCLKVK